MGIPNSTQDRQVDTIDHDQISTVQDSLRHPWNVFSFSSTESSIFYSQTSIREDIMYPCTFPLLQIPTVSTRTRWVAKNPSSSNFLIVIPLDCMLFCVSDFQDAVTSEAAIIRTAITSYTSALDLVRTGVDAEKNRYPLDLSAISFGFRLKFVFAKRGSSADEIVTDPFGSWNTALTGDGKHSGFFTLDFSGTDQLFLHSAACFLLRNFRTCSMNHQPAKSSLPRPFWTDHEFQFIAVSVAGGVSPWSFTNPGSNDDDDCTLSTADSSSSSSYSSPGEQEYDDSDDECYVTDSSSSSQE